MRRWIDLFEATVLHTEYDLESKFNYFNKLCFNNELPTIPCRFGILKRASGHCHQKFYVAPENENKSRAEKVRLAKSYPGGAAIVINRQYVREEAEIDAILVHEMIHAMFYYRDNLVENHGRAFMEKLRECERITGLAIPVTEKVEDRELAPDVKLDKKQVVIIIERPSVGTTLYAMMNPLVFSRMSNDALKELTKRMMRGSVATIYETNSEAWNKKALSAKLQRPKRIDRTVLYYLKDLDLLQDLKASGKVIYTANSDDA